jgi:nucleotide-binding universal stress UspA family protein
MSETGEPHIVVGIDDSAGARHALHWAAREAKLRNVRLDVIHVWAIPAQWAQGYGVEWTIDLEVLGGDAQAVAEELVDGMLTEAERPGHLVVTAIEGNASSVLLEASKTADMLVVGTRGRGGFARLLLGSVSSAIVHHAVCPVVIVPVPSDADEPGETGETDA